MPQPSLWIFSPLALHILKTIINLQNFSIQSCHHRHKGSYTGERHCLFLQPWSLRQPYLTRSRENINVCGVVVHSGLYIPASSYIHQSLLDLVIIYPVLALTHTYEPWYTAFIMCWYKVTFVRAVISSNKPFGKQMVSSHVYVRVAECPLLVWDEIPWLFTDISLTKIHFSLTILPRARPTYSPYSRLLHLRFINTDINQT